MADKDNSIMMALGVDPETAEYKKGSNENLVGDLKEETKKAIGEEFDQFKQESDISQQRGDAKLPRLTELKQASEKSGGNLGSEAALGLMRSIESTVVVETQKVQKAIMKTFLPVEVELKRTIELLSSPNEMAQDEALDRMEAIQKVMGADFEKIASAMGANVNDLIQARQFQREERKKEQDLKEQVKQERLLVRDELRERNINTILDEKTNTLRVQTFAEEKQFKKDIITAEKELVTMTRENNLRIKELRSQDKLTNKEELEIIKRKEKEREQEKKITEMKSKANLQQGPQYDGFFKQTFGAAIDSTKNTFGELKLMGGSLVKGFKNIPNMFSSLGGGLKTAGAGLLKFGVAAAKGLGIGLVIGLVIIGLYKLYKAFQDIKKIWPFSLFGDKEGAEKQPADTSGGALDSMDNDKGGTAMENAYGTPNNQKSVSSTLSTSTTGDTKNYTSEANQITNEAPDNIIPSSVPIIRPIPRPLNVNKMSSDLAAVKDSKPSSTVIAPSNSSNVVNNNTTQSISMLPTNPDRSFINLNTVPI